MSLLTLRGLFERLRAPSQSQKCHIPSKMKLKKWHQNTWHWWQKSAQSSWIFVTSRGIYQSVGVSSRKGEHFPFWTRKMRSKIKPGLTTLLLSFTAGHQGHWQKSLPVKKEKKWSRNAFLAHFSSTFCHWLSSSLTGFFWRFFFFGREYKATQNHNSTPLVMWYCKVKIKWKKASLERWNDT